MIHFKFFKISSAKKYYLYLFFTIILIGGVFYIFQSYFKKEDLVNQNTVSRPVKMLAVKAMTDQQCFFFPAKVFADQKTLLSFQVKGRVIKIPYKVGEKVNKGDLLAKLDDTHYKNHYLECVSKYKETKIQFERAKKLVVGKNVISQSEYDKKQRNYEVAMTELKTAKKELDDSSLYAPYTGTIAKRFVENYQEVKEKEPIFLFQNIRYLEITIYVPGVHLLNSKQGTSYSYYAMFEPDLKKKFKLTLKEHDTVADPQTQSYKVVLKMQRPKNLNVLPGMTARVKVIKTYIGKSTEEKFKIPIDAILPASDDSVFVWLVTKKGTVQKVKIKYSDLSENYVIVNEGLKNNDVIVTSGVHYLHEGQKVYKYKHGKSQN